LRLRARTGPALLGIAAGLVILGALRAVVEPAPAAPPRDRSARAVAPQVTAFAESFARVYLGSDGGRPGARERRLAPYLAEDLDPDAGVAHADRANRAVTWTAVVATHGHGDRTSVTVAAEAGDELLYLAVPVRRDERGFLSVPTYPALVGPPATDGHARSPVERDVEDPELRAVCERAVRNYLSGDRRDLAADLAPETVVSLPSQRLELRSVDTITWAQVGQRAAVLVRAEDVDGAAWTLRYELMVERRERWYVRQIQTDPRARRGET